MVLPEEGPLIRWALWPFKGVTDLRRQPRVQQHHTDRGAQLGLWASPYWHIHAPFGS